MSRVQRGNCGRACIKRPIKDDTRPPKKSLLDNWYSFLRHPVVAKSAFRRKYQKLLTKSYYARLLAVRQVTQDNQGKKTAGVDGIRNLKPKQRFNLVKMLERTKRKARPTRRVWIPKHCQCDEKRPLGIPTMYDRALQGLHKMALEPEWEAIFEPNSYGFRRNSSA
jgi:RNA-directed DNA polymerase